VWFNNKHWLSLPININLYHNIVLDHLIGNSSGDQGRQRIVTITHPMNHSIQQSLDTDSIERSTMFRVVLVQLVFSVIPASFSMLLVEERMSFSKHLQRIFGTPPYLYVLVNLLYDFVSARLL